MSGRWEKIVYRDLRNRFGLSSQMAVRCLAQVCEAYKRDKSIRPVFRPTRRCRTTSGP